MFRSINLFSLAFATVALTSPAMAHMIEAPSEPATLGTPDVRNIEGPSDAKGVKITPAGEMPFDQGTTSLPGHRMRIRYFELAPGGHVPVHSHDNRPAIVYVLEGELIEHRSDQEQPVEHRSGSVALEPHGIVHWFENRSDAPVKGLGFDVHKPE